MDFSREISPIQLDSTRFNSNLGRLTRKVEFKTANGELILFPLEDQNFRVRIVPTASFVCFKCIKNITSVYLYQRPDQTQVHGLEMSMLIDAPHQFSMVEFKKPEILTQYCKLETKEDTLGYFIHHRISGFTGNKILLKNKN